MLNLQDEKKPVQVLFDQGMIVGVAFPAETGEETALGRRLVRGGLVSAENWRKACQQQKEALIGIEKVLVAGGMVTKEDLSAALRLITFDTIYGLFKWKGGTFRFESTPVSYDPEFVEPLASEYLLLDVLRMVDEWPMMAERIPSFDVVLQKKNPLATLDVLNGTDWEKNRTFQMEVIYDLLDGQRSVKEIIELSFVEEFETCKNLITLMDAGLIEAANRGSARKEKKKEQRVSSARRLENPGAYMVVGILAFLLLTQLAVTRLPNLPLSRGEEEGWRTIRQVLKKAQESNLRRAQEVFFLEENRFPQTSAEMAERGLLPR